MVYNLLRWERDQSYLMPPSMRDWLREGHLAWFIMDAVGQMDLREFYSAYRSDGWGAASYDPGMMVAILLYAYCLGLRSSRRIARALEEDVGFRVVAANRQPDFRTICRFRAEQEEAIEELFVEVLRLCHEAGLVKLGVVALDGTKVAANVALATNRSHQAIEEEVQRMLAEAKAADAEEDAHYGPDRRGDELPEGLGGRRERLKRLKEAKERLQREAEAAAKADQEHVEQRRAEEEATGKKKWGRKPKVVEPLPTEEAKANTTDPDSRVMKTRQGYVQGYNAQAVDAEARLLRKGKGKEARLVFMAHALMDNRHGMLVDFQTTQATGTAERDIVPELLDQARERGFHPRTLGGDKGYDTRDFVAHLRRRGVTPHVAQNNKGRSSAIDDRTTRHPGYAVSQRIRKRVEEIFGWMKTVGGFRRTRYQGLDRTGLAGHLVATAYNLVRMAKLLGQAAATPKSRMA